MSFFNVSSLAGNVFATAIGQRIGMYFGNNTQTIIDNVQQQIDKYTIHIVQLSFFFGPSQMDCNLMYLPSMHPTSHSPTHTHTHTRTHKQQKRVIIITI